MSGTSISSELLRIGLANIDGSAVNFSTLTPNQAQKNLGPRAEYFDANASTRVIWMVSTDGNSFVQISSSDSSGTSTPAQLTSATYDGVTGKLTAYTKNSNNYTVTYPSSTSVVIAGGGVTQTITYDSVTGHVLTSTTA
jgi:hypothetical protein